MTIHFAGNEPDCVTGVFAVNTATTALRDTAFSRCALGAGLAENITITLPAEVGGDSEGGWWFHARLKANSITTANCDLDGQLMVLKNGSGNTVVDTPTIENGVITWRHYSASGSGEATPWSSGIISGILLSFDIHVYKSGTDSVCDVYANKALVATVTVAGTSRGVKTISLGGFYAGTPADSTRAWWSEMIVSDTDTREMRVLTAYPSADGTHTDGTGTYADIDEVVSDANAITLAAVGDLQTWSATKTGSPSAAGVLAVCVNGWLASDGTNDMQAVLRVGGTDYLSGDLGLTASGTPSSVVWNVNPATSTAWGLIDVETLEFGHKAVA